MLGEGLGREKDVAAKLVVESVIILADVNASASVEKRQEEEEEEGEDKIITEILYNLNLII